MRKPICSLVHVWWLPFLLAASQPTRLEHGDIRAGALHLFAAFDTRTGKVYARTEARKRQKEFIALLTQLDQEIPSAIRRIFLVLDNSSVHKGKRVQAWLQVHPRFVCWFLPVHCRLYEPNRTVVRPCPQHPAAHQRLHRAFIAWLNG